LFLCQSIFSEGKTYSLKKDTMKILLSFCICLFAVISNSFAQDEAELIKKVKAKLDKVNDYTAQGKMKIDVSFIDAPDSKVIVYYKKPDRFKVKKAGGISILPKGGISINMGTLLANENYDIVPGKDIKIKGVDTKVIKLLPQNENSDVVLTTLYIEEKNSVIRKAIVTTKENGSYEIELDYGSYIEWGLPDKAAFLFNTKDYKLPKGITFEYEKGDKKKQEALKNKKGKVEITYSSYIINKGIDDTIFSN
jgi:outer membrane lipoprotein-sorting protein